MTSTSIRIEQQYDLTVAADTTAPKVRVIAGWNIVNPGEEVTFQAVATDNIKVANLQLLVNNTSVILDAQGFATVTLSQPGVVTARAIATDIACCIGNATTTVTVTDPTDTDAPVVNLDLSAYASKTITALTNIIGIDDTNLAYYTLEVAPVGSNDFTEVFRGTSSVTNGVLGKFDSFLLQNDTYTLRLSAYDTNGQGSIISDTISVAGNLKLGNFRLSFTDLSIPVTGIPIALTRTYDTLTSNTQDDFGYGWRMKFRDTDLRTSLPTDLFYQELDDRTVGFQDGTRVYITIPSGVRQGFTFKARVIDSDWNAVMGYRFRYPTFVADKGVTSTLSVPDAKYQANIISGSTSGNGNNILMYDANGDLINLAGRPYYPGDNGFGGIYLLTTSDGVVYEIDANTGDLNSVTDTNGNKLTYTDAAITSSTGQKITFGRDAMGRITTVTDPLGNQVALLNE